MAKKTRSTRIWRPEQARRNTRKQEKKEEDLRETQNYRPQFRSNLNSICTLLQSLHLTDNHKAALQRTAFWHFFNAIINGNLQTSILTKSRQDVVKVVQAYNPTTKRIKLGRRQLQLSSGDVSLIFGISSGSNSVEYSQATTEPSSFIQRRFPKTKKIFSPHIKKELLSAYQGNTENDIEDVARLLCMYACSTLFFSTSGHHIPWKYVRCIEDLDNMHTYSWSVEIVNKLIEGLDKSVSDPNKATGCVPLLLFWLCEHSTILDPPREKLFPRFLNWDLRKLHDTLKRIDLSKLKSNQVLEVDELTPTQEEQNLQLEGAQEEEDDEASDPMQIKNSVESEQFEEQNESEKVEEFEALFEENREEMEEEEGEQHPQMEDEEETEHNQPSSMHPVDECPEQTQQKSSEEFEISEQNIPSSASLQPTVSLGEDMTPVHWKLQELNQKIEEIQRNNLKKLDEIRNQYEIEAAKLREQIKHSAEEAAKLREDSVQQQQQLKQHHENEMQALQAQLTREKEENDGVVQRLITEKEVEAAYYIETIYSLEMQISRLNSQNTKLEDIIDEYEVHKVTQQTAHQSVGEEKNEEMNEPVGDEHKEQMNEPPSYVQRIKTKKRAAKIDTDFTYQKTKKLRKKKMEEVAKNEEKEKEVIEVEELPNTKERKDNRNLLAALQTSPVSNFLTAEEKQRLNEIFEHKGITGQLWSGAKNSHVYMDDVYELLVEGQISNNIIDAYGEQLERYIKQTRKKDDRSFFFSSLCWTFIKEKNHYQLEDHINKFLLGKERQTTFLHFPINTSGRKFVVNHWSLLTFDRRHGQWTHYNSLRPRTAKNKDQYFEDAKKLIKYVQKFMEEHVKIGYFKENDLDGPLQTST